jgi:predicted HTH transcriptional regulator
LPANEISKATISPEADSSQGQSIVKDNMKNNVLNKMSDKNQKTDNKTIKDKNDRQDTIKSMLKGGIKLTIKDFAKNIKDCSEKTIQRELVEMVAKGVLKKEGERRWSKYFLA